MKPARRRTWFVIAGVILLLSLVGVRVVGGLLGNEGGADRSGLSMPPGGEGEVDTGADAGRLGEGGDRTDSDGLGAQGGDDPADSGDPAADDPDTVPISVVYDLVDQLRDAGTGPVEATDVVVEYEGAARDVIVMRGEFEGTSATEIRFERRGGAWVQAERE